MSISFFQQIYTAYYAAKDSRGAYGLYFLDWCSQIKRTNVSSLCPSQFMEFLVINYTIKCKKIIARRICIPILYSKILNICEKINDITQNINDQISIIETQIAETENEIKEQQSNLDIEKKHWISVNQTGIITSEMNVANMTELNNNIDRLENAIKGLENKKSKLRSEAEAKSDEAKEKMQIQVSQLKKNIIFYNYKIDSLYKVIDMIGIRYSEYMRYYWNSFYNNLTKKHANDINIECTKSFFEICQLCNFQLIQKENLFEKERELINKKICKLTDLEIVV